MKVIAPRFFSAFHCIADRCSDSCCIGWEVVIDEDTARRYRAEPGPLGEKLRAAMQFDGEDVCFPLDGGRCPFLNRENLCEIHCPLGAEATSVTCQEHPRFIEEYGTFKEITLSAACPKANELLLGSNEPLTFSVLDFGVPSVLIIFGISIVVSFAAVFVPVFSVVRKTPVEAIREAV